MNDQLEKKFWNAGKRKESYTKEIWYEIIESLLDDFQKFIGQDFQRDPEIILDIEDPNSPSFSRWMWASKGNIFPLSPAWSAVIGGSMIGTETGENIFGVSISLFLFDVTSKKRLCLKTGESVLDFLFEKQSNGYGCWRIFGWWIDEWGEWEHLESY